MGLGQGPGTQYWVHVIKYFDGSLEECISFMKNNPPLDDTQWYELNPVVHIKKGVCNSYMCNLVEMMKGEKDG